MTAADTATDRVGDAVHTTPTVSASDVLVTAATGTVGRHVVEYLVDGGATVRAGTRNPERASLPDGARPTAFDYERPETWGAALSDVDGVFLVLPPGTTGADRVAAFAEAADRVGVDRIVFLSTLGADRLPILPHRRVERRLEPLLATTTFLRASFFLQNLTEVHGEEIRETGEILVPAGDGRTSFVDARDVAAVAAAALTDETPRPGALDLTGPAALTYHEVAAVCSEATGRDIDYRAPSALTFLRQSVPKRGLGFSLTMVGIYTTARLGLAGRVTDTVAEILGRPPRTVREFAADNADAWRA